ncbi:MAG: CBS domain-containing protein [Candidatus Aenigmatarchaeota archaeon]
MLVKNVMKKDVTTASEETTIQEASRIMADNHIGCLVITKNNTVTGIVTEYDILRSVAEGKDAEKKTVAHIMTPYIHAVTPDQKLEAAIKILKKERIKKLLVMDGRKLIGILTATDIIISQPQMISELKSVLKKKRSG